MELNYQHKRYINEILVYISYSYLNLQMCKVTNVKCYIPDVTLYIYRIKIYQSNDSG